MIAAEKARLAADREWLAATLMKLANARSCWRWRVDTVIVTGCNTSGCIRASAIDSFSYRCRTIVPEDCVGDIEEQPHRDNLRDIGRRYVDVSDLATVLAYFEEWRKSNA